MRSYLPPAFSDNPLRVVRPFRWEWRPVRKRRVRIDYAERAKALLLVLSGKSGK